jgi:flagellar basal-body rod protein FlgB
MGSQEMFNGTISILEKSLDIRSMKHNLLVSNIANKDTPNYKAFDLAVEEEMQKLTGTNKTVSLWKTQSGHLGANGETCSEVSITKSSKGFEQNIDGNTVDIEKEMTNLAENNLLYDAMAQIMRKKLQGLKVAIQGGSK